MFFLFGPLICAAVLLTVFCLRGIWPFGSESVAFYDMGQAVLPYYYHIYDWLKGLDGLNWDWLSGLGVSLAASGLPMPVDLLILLFRREELINALGVLFAARVCLSCLTAQISLKTMFPMVNALWLTALSAAYALSTYSLYYYTNIFWLDFVILYPLLVCGLKSLLDNGKILLYTVTYSILLAVSYYQGFMVTLSVLFVGGLYLLLLVSKDLQARRAVQLGVATVTGGLISCARFLPSTIPALTSSRMGDTVNNGEGLIKGILGTAPDTGFNPKLRLVMGLSLLLLLAGGLIYASFRKRKRRAAVFALCSMLSLFIQIPFESVDLIWHGGSYIYFPLRFFFISVFISACLAAAYLNEYANSRERPRSGAMNIALLVATGVSTAAYVYSLIRTGSVLKSGFEATVSVQSALMTAAAGLFAGCAGYAFALMLGKRAAGAVSLAIVILQGGVTGYFTVANKEFLESQETFYNSASFVDYCREVSGMDLDAGVLGRTQNPDTSLNTNYPWLLRTYSISNWSHVIPSYLQDTLHVLGFSNQFTRLLDQGGTAFTQSLLNVKQAVARKEYRMPSYYSLKEETENFALYSNDLAFDLGLFAGEDVLTDFSDRKGSLRLEAQNEIYSIFSGDSEKLIDICSLENDDSDEIDCMDKSLKKCAFVYTAGENEILYLNANGFKYNGNTLKVYVNGELLNAPYYKHTQFHYYPNSSVNGLVSLGCFEEGETVSVEMFGVNETTLRNKSVALGCMKLDKLEKLREEQSGHTDDLTLGKYEMSFTVDNDTGSEKYLFVPVTFHDGFECSLNGEKTELFKALGAFTAIKVPPGKSSVRLRFTPPLQKAGIILSLAGCAALAIWLILRRKGITSPAFFDKAVFAAFCLAFSAGVIFVYIIPSGFSIVLFIKNLFTLT